MSVKEEAITEDIIEAFKHVKPVLEKRYARDWDDYEIEKAWSNQVIAHQTFYHLQVRLGSFPNVHHYSIEVEQMPGSWKLRSVEEGKKSMF